MNIHQQVEELIRSQKNAYMCSVDGDSFPNIKVLEVRGIKGIKEFYFSTASTTLRVRQFANNPKSCLYFSDNEKYTGVMLIGTTEVSVDEEPKRIVWHDGDDFYYPQGFNAPTFCVLKFTARSGRYFGPDGSEDFSVE